MDNSNVNTDLIRDHVDTIILATLANGDRYGLDILTEIKEKSKDLYELKQATLYSCLKRLEKQGLLTSYKGDTSNGAQRVYYSLLDDGRKFLENDQYQWEYARTIIDGLLSDKVFDKDKTPPFNASDLRPRTKRQPRSEPSAQEAAHVNDGQILVNQVAENVEYLHSADDDQNTSPSEAPQVEDNFKFVSYNGDLKTVIVKKDAVIYQEDVDYRDVLDNIFDNTNNNCFEPATAPFAPFNNTEYSSNTYVENEYNSESNYYSLESITKKFQTEGFTIKPYLKKNTTDYYVNKYVYINKLMLTTSLVSYGIFALTLLIMHLSTFKSYATPITSLFISLGVIALIPIACVFSYIVNPNKRITANYSIKKTFTVMSILLVNAFLVIIIVGFIVLGANFTEKKLLVQSVVFPTIILLLIPMATFLYSYLYSTNHYHVN